MCVRNKVKVECNKKDEVVLARKNVVNKVDVQDFLGMKTNLNKAHALFLQLEGFHQIQAIIMVFMTTEMMFGTNLMDWYAIL
jgi:hypothetical protein